ncbi:MAG TPA: hypothetical protein VNH22_02900, partial [Blastocatellia bacterium]|nr:hypothetical protein [Blastocatellia bacterium]
MLPPVNSFWIKLALSFFLLTVCVGSGLAMTVVIPSDEEMIIGARAIVRARVLATSGGLDEEKAEVYTYVTLQVEEVLKGRVVTSRVVLKQPGGEFGGRGAIVYGSPRFQPGESVLLYLDSWPDGSLRVHQMYLGKFSILKDPGTGLETVVRSSPTDSPGVIGRSIAGSVTDRLELGAYTEMVRAQLAANWERALQFEERYYGATPLLMRPPGFNGAESEEVRPQFATTSPAICWFEAGSGQTVPVITNLDGAPFSPVSGDISAAVNAWSTAPGISIQLTNGGATGLCGDVSGRVSVVFNNCDGLWSPGPGCSGVLAQTRISYA